MPGKDSSAPVIDLDLPGAFPSGSFEAEVESSDAREERAESHSSPRVQVDVVGTFGRLSGDRAAPSSPAAYAVS